MTLDAIREAIVAGIADLNLAGFAVSQELPWDAAGTALYTKNPKTFYVSRPDTEETNLINTLCGGSQPSLSTRVITVRAFVTTDAKTPPTNYGALVESVPGVKNTAAITGVRSREVDVQSTFEADSLETEFVFRFTELKIN
jgi:hypothetical protein